jgi:hypothetical protein
METRNRRRIVAAALVACVILVAVDAWRHRNDPEINWSFLFPESREHALQRQAEQRERLEAWRVQARASIIRSHEDALRALADAESAMIADPCAKTPRVNLRSSIVSYVVMRINSNHNAVNEGLASDFALSWNTLDDRDAIAIAVDAIARGYILSSDLPPWRPEYAKFFPPPPVAPPACRERLD